MQKWRRPAASIKKWDMSYTSRTYAYIKKVSHVIYILKSELCHIHHGHMHTSFLTYELVMCDHFSHMNHHTWMIHAYDWHDSCIHHFTYMNESWVMRMCASYCVCIILQKCVHHIACASYKCVHHIISVCIISSVSILLQKCACIISSVCII